MVAFCAHFPITWVTLHDEQRIARGVCASGRSCHKVTVCALFAPLLDSDVAFRFNFGRKTLTCIFHSPKRRAGYDVDDEESFGVDDSFTLTLAGGAAALAALVSLQALALLPRNYAHKRNLSPLAIPFTCR